MSTLLIILMAFGISVYSWGYVESTMPFMKVAPLRVLVFAHGTTNGILYTAMLICLFAWYAYVLYGISRRTVSPRQMWIRIFLLIGILFMSFPAFSNDLFNYIATAKVTYLYHENPYLVMPIDIPNEPMLRFLQAANKTALYGPTWILITYLPHVVGVGNLLVTMYVFKLVAVAGYLWVLLMIRKLTGRPWAVAFFAFNPLVVIDTLVDAHNDVIMMGLALFAFYLLKKKQFVMAWVLLSLSVFVKGATLFLMPVFVYACIKRSAVDWERVWFWAAVSMFAVFLLSPIREEIYSWYFIWVLSFMALRKNYDVATAVSLGFSFGLPLRFLPFAVTREWTGSAYMVKKIVTFVPPVVTGAWYALFSKNHYGKR